jgi:hypothetical protein
VIGQLGLSPQPACGRLGLGLLDVAVMVKSQWRLSRYFCRHEFVRRFGRDRLWLECTSCGFETAGIHVRAHAATELTTVAQRLADRFAPVAYRHS